MYVRRNLSIFPFDLSQAARIFPGALTKNRVDGRGSSVWQEERVFTPLPLFSRSRVLYIRDLEKSTRLEGRSDKCARGSSGRRRGKDETFAAGSPLEAHGRFSGGRAAVALAFLGPGF